MDGALDLDRAATVLQKLDLDLIALQEVDEVCTRSDKMNQACQRGGVCGPEEGRTRGDLSVRQAEGRNRSYSCARAQLRRGADDESP